MDKSIWKNITYRTGRSEATPFLFKGKKYVLYNLTAFNEGNLAKGEADRAVIYEAGTDKKVCEVLLNHYFNSAFVAGDKCYCVGSYMGDHPGRWLARKIDIVWSEDMIHWSEPLCILDYPYGYVYNTSTIFDGERYIMLFETDDKRYPIFTFRFLESKDLQHWRLMDKEIYGDKKYVGGPALYYMPQDKRIYLSYGTEFINEETKNPNYDTYIARTRNLIDWEEGNRPILFPDYTHRPMPVEHPDVYEINTSDAEYVEENGKVTVYYCGGNQHGVCDFATAEYEGTLFQLFNEYFKPLKRVKTGQEELEERDLALAAEGLAR